MYKLMKLVFYAVLKNPSKYFGTTLIYVKAAPLDGFLDHYGYRSPDPDRLKLIYLFVNDLNKV